MYSEYGDTHVHYTWVSTHSIYPPYLQLAVSVSTHTIYMSPHTLYISLHTHYTWASTHTIYMSPHTQCISLHTHYTWGRIVDLDDRRKHRPKRALYKLKRALHELEIAMHLGKSRWLCFRQSRRSSKAQSCSCMHEHRLYFSIRITHHSILNKTAHSTHSTHNKIAHYRYTHPCWWHQQSARPCSCHINTGVYLYKSPTNPQMSYMNPEMRPVNPQMSPFKCIYKISLRICKWGLWIRKWAL